MLNEYLDEDLKELFLDEISHNLFSRTVYGQPLTYKEIQIFDLAMVRLAKTVELKFYCSARMIEYHKRQYDEPFVEEAL